MINKQVVGVAIICILTSSIITYAFTRNEINSQKKLTKRILTNAVKSMETYQQLANSCSQAYNTATICVSNLNTCNLAEESKKLEEFNKQKESVDPQISLLNKDMESIINEVSAKR